MLAAVSRLLKFLLPNSQEPLFFAAFFTAFFPAFDLVLAGDFLAAAFLAFLALLAGMVSVSFEILRAC